MEICTGGNIGTVGAFGLIHKQSLHTGTGTRFYTSTEQQTMRENTTRQTNFKFYKKTKHHYGQKYRNRWRVWIVIRTVITYLVLYEYRTTNHAGEHYTPNNFYKQTKNTNMDVNVGTVGAFGIIQKRPLHFRADIDGSRIIALIIAGMLNPVHDEVGQTGGETGEHTYPPTRDRGLPRCLL